MDWFMFRNGELWDIYPDDDKAQMRVADLVNELGSDGLIIIRGERYKYIANPTLLRVKAEG